MGVCIALSIVVVSLFFRRGVMAMLSSMVGWFSVRKEAAGGAGNLALNFMWFLFVVVIVGQMGPILVVASAFWGGEGVFDEIDRRAGNGELILCSTAILVGATYFIVKEYSSNSVLAAGRGHKSWAVLLAIIFSLWGVVLASGLLLDPGFKAGAQRAIHWFVYACSLLLSFFLWFIEYSDAPATQEVNEYDSRAKGMTRKSASQEQDAGVKV